MEAAACNHDPLSTGFAFSRDACIQTGPLRYDVNGLNLAGELHVQVTLMFCIAARCMCINNLLGGRS